MDLAEGGDHDNPGVERSEETDVDATVGSTRVQDRTDEEEDSGMDREVDAGSSNPSPEDEEEKGRKGPESQYDEVRRLDTEGGNRSGLSLSGDVRRRFSGLARLRSGSDPRPWRWRAQDGLLLVQLLQGVGIVGKRFWIVNAGDGL